MGKGKGGRGIDEGMTKKLKDECEEFKSKQEGKAEGVTEHTFISPKR